MSSDAGNRRDKEPGTSKWMVPSLWMTLLAGTSPMARLIGTENDNISCREAHVHYARPPFPFPGFPTAASTKEREECN